MRIHSFTTKYPNFIKKPQEAKEKPIQRRKRNTTTTHIKKQTLLFYKQKHQTPPCCLTNKVAKEAQRIHLEKKQSKFVSHVVTNQQQSDDQSNYSEYCSKSELTH